MKRLVKRGLKLLWRSTEPVRRPILGKVEQFLRRCLQPNQAGLVNETDVLMDHVVRELVRLQCQVEALHQTLLEVLPAAREVPAIAGGIEPDQEDHGTQLKAG